MRHRLKFFMSLVSCVLLLNAWNSYAQESIEEKKLIDKLRFAGDFRFRIEQDWNSRRSDGTYRDDRTRLRYRARFSVTYTHNHWASFGMGLRTGYREKQQDPHLTLGDGFNEYASVPVGFEKLYFRAQYKWLDAWIGKNAFPFERKNELFWSDNVYPDGVYLGAGFEFDKNWIDRIKFSGGHFILTSSGSSFDRDSYVQVLQVASRHWNDRLVVFPTFYYFRQMPNIPDGFETHRFDYSIFHLGTEVRVVQKPAVTLGLDLYQNLENYASNDSIPDALKDEKKGAVGSIVVGELKKKGDFMAGVYLTYLERYSAVDFLAQNDWARWDYSEFGSPDGRLTNYKGVELVAAYRLNKSMKLKMRYFKVEQLLPYGQALENGDRIRLDLDIWF